MASIRLQFSLAPRRALDPGPFLIEWFDRGLPFSHVDAVLPDGRLLGAQRKQIGKWPPGIQIRDPDYEQFRRKLVVELETSTDIAGRFYALLKLDIDTPFDSLGQWDFLFDRGWHTRNARFCSEEITRRLLPEPMGCGYFQYPLALPPHKVTPGDLLLVLSSRVAIPAQ